MTEEDWEMLETEVVDILNGYGIPSVVEDAEDLTYRFMLALRRKFREVPNDDSND